MSISIVVASGGRYLLLSFFGSAARASSQALLRGIFEHRSYFDDEHFSFFGVTAAPDDERLERVKEQLPVIRFFWDFDSNISRLYGVIRTLGVGIQYRPASYVIDPNLRVLKVLRIDDDSTVHVKELIAFLSALPKIEAAAPAALQAPVLVLARIFEPEFCRRLTAALPFPSASMRTTTTAAAYGSRNSVPRSTTLQQRGARWCFPVPCCTKRCPPQRVRATFRFPSLSNMMMPALQSGRQTGTIWRMIRIDRR